MLKRIGIVSICTVAACISSPCAFADVLLWSTQGQKVTETQSIRDEVLPGAGVKINFEAPDGGAWYTRLQAELNTGKGTIGLVGGLHGQLSGFDPDDFIDLSGIDLGDVTVPPSFLELGKLGTTELKYLPWMQATYIMAANKKALPYLPDGADINSLTYDELIQWAKNLEAATGSRKFGIPAGTRGLKHRFFQGYLYPSYADSMVTKFRSPKAKHGWRKFKELWQYAHPACTRYNRMQDPLKTGDIWVAFDHVGNLAEAFKAAPNDYVAFPAPSGTEGRGYMPVLAGLAIPRTAPNIEESKAAIVHLLKRDIQLKTLSATNFFPVVDVEVDNTASEAARLSGAAISKMSNASDAKPALLPVGLGDLDGRFNLIFSDTFERIVIYNQPIDDVLDDQAKSLRKLLNKSGAPCWAPDPISEGACPVD